MWNLKISSPANHGGRHRTLLFSKSLNSPLVFTSNHGFNGSGAVLQKRLIARRNQRIRGRIRTWTNKNKQEGKEGGAESSQIGNFERTYVLNDPKDNWRSYHHKWYFFIKNNYKICVRLCLFVCICPRGRENWYSECKIDIRPVFGKNNDKAITSMM